MASFNGVTTSNPSVAFGGRSAPPRNGVTLDPAGGTVTYCYRESGGTRGTATSLGAIPAGAEIERTVTT